MLLSQGELFHVLRLVDDLNRPPIHPLLFLLSSQRLEVLQEDLIVEQRKQPLEEVIEGDFNIVVIVALQPLLYEEVVLLRGKDDLVGAEGKAFEVVLDAGVDLQDLALFDFEDPAAGLQLISVDQLEHRFFDRHILVIAQQEGRDELVLLKRIEMIPEDLAVIAIDDRHFFSLLIDLIDNEGLIDDLLAAEIRRQEMRDHKVDDILVANGKNLRHFR